MNITTLRWTSIVGPTLFVVAFEIVTRALYSGLIPQWGHVLVALSAVSVAAFLFSRFVFATMAQLEREVRERNKRLALLNTLSAELSESLDTRQVAGLAARKIAAALDAEAAGITLTDDDGKARLVGSDGPVVVATPLSEDVQAPELRPDCGCSRVVRLGKTIITPSSGEDDTCAGLVEGQRATTCVTAPIKSKGRNIGAVFVARDATRPFTDDEVELVSAVGSQVGSFLENAQLFTRAEALAVLQERERVAREVHDGLAQTLGYLNVQMGIVDHLLRRGDTPRALTEVEQMSAVTREAYGDLRQAIVDLRTSLPSTTGLRRALREYAEDFSRRTGIPCHFEGHKGVAAAVSPSVEVQVIRIVQEALTNVKKHAPGSNVWLAVEASPAEVQVCVRDNGPGFVLETAQADQSRFGLRSMAERASSVGGKVTIRSTPGIGTSVDIVMPSASARNGNVRRSIPAS